MKTVNEIRTDTARIIKNTDPKELSKSEKSEINKYLAMNRKMITAIRAGVSESGLLDDLGNLKTKLAKIENRYSAWLKNAPVVEYGANPQSTYNRLMNVTNIKKQINFINELLS